MTRTAPLTIAAPPPGLDADPGVRGSTKRDTWLTHDDGSQVRLPAGTPCFVRHDTVPSPTAPHVQVEICREESLSWLARWHDAPKFSVVDRGTVPAGDTKLARDGKYRPVEAPLFTHPPRPQDVVQGDSRVCALAAAVQSLVGRDPQRIQNMLWDHGDGSVSVRLYEPRGDAWAPRWIRVAKSLPRGTSRSRGASVWYQLLEKAVAVSGWPGSSTPSHGQACPGGYCNDFMQRLTGEPAFARCCDWRRPGYLMSMLLDCLQAGTPGPSPFTEADRAAVRRLVQRQPNLLTAVEDPRHTTSSLMTLLLQYGVAAPLQRKLVGYIDAAVAAMQHSGAPLSLMERFMGDALMQALRQGKPVCVSTRPQLDSSLEPRRISRAGDLFIRARRHGYGYLVKHERARGGMLAEHAYAVLDMRQEAESCQVLLAEPSGQIGRNYVSWGAERRPVPSTHAVFWIDLHDLFCYIIGLYVSG